MKSLMESSGYILMDKSIAFDVMKSVIVGDAINVYAGSNVPLDIYIDSSHY